MAHDRRRKLTKELMLKELESKKSHTLDWFRKGRKILSHDRMKKRYLYTLSENPGENFRDDFNPFYTPGQMLAMGVFEGKYCNDQISEFPQEWYVDAWDKLSPEGADISCNYFSDVKSRQSLQVWEEKKWIIEPDRRGWFEWYMRYWIGRRIPKVDDVQIKRWKGFKRHYSQVLKHAGNDMSKRRRQRQALLQWAWPIK